MKAVVITFDRWHCGFLGCQGNPWIDTPHLDQFALNATSFDQHFAENLSTGARNHAWWTGRFQFPLDLNRQQIEPAWLPLLARQDVKSTLLHDPAASLPINVPQFASSKSISLDDVAGLDFQKESPRFVRAAMARIRQMAQSPDVPELFWIHASGLPIDTPSVAYEDLYSDSEPTELAESATETDVDESQIDFFPQFWRRKRSSPRELADARLQGSGWTNTAGAEQTDWRTVRDMYSGQATQWDAWLGQIIEVVHELQQQTPVMLIFTAGQGDHLGEHAVWGADYPLFEEQIHVPLLISIPTEESFQGRRRVLSQDVDLAPTLLDWFCIPVPQEMVLDGYSLLSTIRDDQPLPRDTAYACDSHRAGIRTADHYYHRVLDGAESAASESIFIKPDDRWDANNLIRQFTQQADEYNQKWIAHVNQVQTRT